MLKSKDRPLPNLTYMSEDQMGEPSLVASVPCTYTPPRPSRLRECPSAATQNSPSDTTAKYLGDLRSNRQSRQSLLNGSRPPPPSRLANLKRSETDAVEHSASAGERPHLPTSNSMPVMPPGRPNRALSHRRAESTGKRANSFLGRPLVQEPSSTAAEPSSTEPRPGMVRPPSMIYRDSGQRWMEKQEAHSIRMAMEDMDMEDERKIHAAARDEAAGLVWKHQNPEAKDVPFRSPDFQRDYHGHLRKGSYERSHSQGVVKQGSACKPSGGSSKRSSLNGAAPTARISIDDALVDTTSTVRNITRIPSCKSYGGLAEAVAIDVVNARRRISSGSKRILSGEKKLFMHPNDRIFEDPTEEATPPKKQLATSATTVTTQRPAYVRKNPFARVRMAHEKLERSNSEPLLSTGPRLDRIEIQKNPPTQAKKPWYMANEPLPPTPPKPKPGGEEDPSKPQTPTKDGVEIRGDDIRSATAMKRKDRSPNLPQPTVVSDEPGRPIVSFKPDWKPKEVVLEQVYSKPMQRDTVEPLKVLKGVNTPPTEPMAPKAHTVAVPQGHVDEGQGPPIPSICLPDDQPKIPTIVLPEEPEFSSSSAMMSAPNTPTICVEPPSINISGPYEFPLPPSAASQRPLPVHSRPRAHHAVTAPLPGSSHKHITPSIRRPGALCAHCALPIAGRILSAAGERFHPDCFTCHACATNLECVAFYPEPDNRRSERVDRIQTRQSRQGLPKPDGATTEDIYQLEFADGDETLRFYCHLDFHELYSPRCKSCKTPIEGEVVVACGADWHVGHFFCAQCGDPFDSKTPFVEKDGYAWCVNCHTNRYSSKCRKCKKPVTDVVVKALGYDWHGNCFCCIECNGEFEDERFFLRGESQDPVCVKCEERRLKA